MFVAEWLIYKLSFYFSWKTQSNTNCKSIYDGGNDENDDDENGDGVDNDNDDEDDDNICCIIMSFCVYLSHLRKTHNLYIAKHHVV